MKRTWIYLNNTFLNITKGSFKRMLSICNQHLAFLEAEKSDPVILRLYNNTKEYVEKFNSDYSTWGAAKASLKGETFRFQNSLKEISQKLIRWNVGVQKWYNEKTPEYKAIFPNGRIGFYSGTYEQRINELEALKIQLSKYVVLSEILADVIDYTNKLKACRNIQQQKAEQIDNASEILENKRILLSQVLYGNLGMLMCKFSHQPDIINKFFNLNPFRKKIRNKKESENGSFTKLIPPGKIVEIGLAFSENAVFLMINNSHAIMGVYASVENPSEPPMQLLIINPDEVKEVHPAKIGSPGSRFLFIVNKDLEQEGKMDISLL
jgi:hypothetical protein